MEVAILHELIHQNLQSVLVAESFKGAEMTMMKAAEQNEFIAELCLALCTCIGGTFDGNYLSTNQNAAIDCAKSTLSNATLVTKIISCFLQFI